MSPLSGRTFRRVTCMALLGLAVGAPAVARAGVSFGTAISLAPSMSAGTTGIATSLTLTNLSANGPGESGYDTDSYRLDTLTAVLGCGSASFITDCPFGSKDGGAIVPGATGTGRGPTACEGATFTIARVGAALDGKYSFTPGATVLLGPSSGGSNGRQCIVDFTVSAVRTPAIDASLCPCPPGLTGLQTVAAGYGAFADVTAGQHAGETGAGFGSTAVTISQAQPTIATQASGNISLGQGTLSDQATVSGLVSPVSGTVEFRLYAPNDATCTSATATFSGVALTLNGPHTQGTAVSPPFTPAASGQYRWRAFYSGDANNAPVSGSCNVPSENTTVLPAQPSLVTQASPSIPLGGGSLSDQATLSGLVSPVAGTIQFRLYGPGDPTCLAPVVTFSDVALVLNGPHTQGTATSPSFAPTTVGTYRWRAFYSGDANNAVTNGACGAPDESTSVVVPQSSIETVASAGIALGAGSLTDKATVSGLVNPVTGTVEFRVYGPDDATCTTPAESFPGAALTYDAARTSATATSPPFTPTAAGTYRWRAFYSGDANNLAVGAPCNAPNESVTVTASATPPPPPPPPPPPRGAPVITTLASAGVVLGGQVRDTAVVTGRVNPVAGSTVEFRLYGPDDAACASPVFTSTVALSDAGTAASAPFTPGRAGTYRWRAFSGGDANNDAASGFCDAPGERVVVTLPAGPRALVAFAAPPRAGASARLVVTARDPENPIAGVRVDFGEPRGAMGISGCIAPTLALLPDVVRQQVRYTFKRSGPHVVSVTVLSGGCAAPQLRTTVPLAVTVAPRAATRAVLRAALPAAASAPRVAAGCKNRALTPTPADRLRVAAAVLCLVNVERRQRARKVLRPAPRLALAATNHATDMFRRGYFAHEHTPGGPSLVTRLRRARWLGPTYAENIGYASDGNATRIVQAWMNSPRQRANILHLRLKYAGVGVAAAIPDSPARPGATFTLDLGASLR